MSFFCVINFLINLKHYEFNYSFKLLLINYNIEFYNTIRDDRNISHCEFIIKSIWNTLLVYMEYTSIRYQILFHLCYLMNLIKIVGGLEF